MAGIGPRPQDAYRALEEAELRDRLDYFYQALLLIEEALSTLAADQSEDGRRIYLAYIASIDAREPIESRTAEIAQLRERLGLK